MTDASFHSVAVPPLTGLLAQYRAAGGGYDELLASDGKVRPHYEALMGGLAELGTAEIRRRSDTCRRLVHEHGITYNVYGDPLGVERPWQLDPVPFLLSAEEWRGIEAGLVQRATLLDRVLADCYGVQDLIRTAWLPPALVFAQPDFLRPLNGSRPEGGRYLHFYAADLARSPDGRWWVISDRTQIPTGTGYALANRLVTSRILPEAFLDCGVNRLAGFFRDAQSALAGLSPRRTEQPRVVLLTPGPFNETYFEQSYLARYLGYSLCEGQDLTVRDGRVYLKTLSGLEQVDVILRRVDDEFCDPLELRNESMLGVPGLVEAVRAGNVVVANAMGSGLLQSPAFMSLLPGLARHVLGEELKLPSVATWWCGQKAAERYVEEHLDQLFVKPAFRSHLRGSDPDAPLTQAERETLRRRIRFQPHLWVGQERVDLSRAPSWNGESLVPRSVALRVYVVATPDGYRVMPGGLARITPDAGGHRVSMQRGGAAKDTWVLADGPVEDVTLLSVAGREVELRRVGNNLPSRLADNYFWLGRYAERADSTSRLLRSTLLRFSPESTGHAFPLLEPLLNTLVAQGQLPAPALQPELRSNAEALEAALLAVIFDPDQPSSLRRLAGHLQRLGMRVRDRSSNDLWRVLRQLDERLATPASSLVMLAGDAIGVLNQLLLQLASFQGLSRENMTRAQGWRFLDMGGRLERAIYLCTLLDAALRSPEADNPSVLEAVLEVADSSITYRARYNLMPNMAAVYDLVLLDDTNPRSLLFQLERLVKHFAKLPREKETALPSPGQRVLLECVTRLRLLDPQPINRLTGRWHESDVGSVIRDTLRDLPRLSDALAVGYFAHSAISRSR